MLQGTPVAPEDMDVDEYADLDQDERTEAKLIADGHALTQRGNRFEPSYRATPPRDCIGMMQDVYDELIFNNKVLSGGVGRELQGEIAGYKSNDAACRWLKATDHASWNVEQYLWGSNAYPALLQFIDIEATHSDGQPRLGKATVCLRVDDMEYEEGKWRLGGNARIQYRSWFASAPSCASS